MEIVRTVLVLALAVGVAVLVLTLAAYMWPPVKPYGEALPYVTFKNTSKGIQLGVFDYSNIKPRAVHIYVNGRLAGSTSGEGWSNVYVKCGDYVEALFQYDSFDRRVAGRIGCSKPFSAMSVGGVVLDPASVKIVESFHASNGYLDSMGLPAKAYLVCEDTGPSVWDLRYKVFIKLYNHPDAVGCIGAPPNLFRCGRELLISSRDAKDIAGGGTFWDYLNYTVFKTPSAVASNYLGGGTIPIKVKADLTRYSVWDLEATEWNVYLYINGKEVYLGQCYKSQYDLGFKEYNWTDYKMPNASAVIFTCNRVNITDANGEARTAIMKKATILYQNKDGSFGYRTHTVITNNTNGCPTPDRVWTSATFKNGNVTYTVSLDALIKAVQEGVLIPRDKKVLKQFLDWAAKQPNGLVRHLIDAFLSPKEIEFNVQRIAVNKTGLLHLGFKTNYDPNAKSFSFYIGTMDMFALGAVLATSVMPLPYDLPKVVKPVGNTTSVIT
jgi:hypothetical protein